MTIKVSKNKKIVLVVSIAIATACFYGYSKVNYAETIANGIEKIAPFANERLALERVHETDKNFTLELTISGVASNVENINEFKSHYDEVALNYICQSSQYDSPFEEGYHISLDIKYLDEPDKTFNRIYVSKEKCAELSI